MGELCMPASAAAAPALFCLLTKWSTPLARSVEVTAEGKRPDALGRTGLGRVGIRSAQVLLILTVAVVSVFALMQIKLLVIPVLIALILAAAIGPSSTCSGAAACPAPRPRGWPLWPCSLCSPASPPSLFSVRSQWGELASRRPRGWMSWSTSCSTAPSPWTGSRSTGAGRASSSSPPAARSAPAPSPGCPSSRSSWPEPASWWSSCSSSSRTAPDLELLPAAVHRRTRSEAAPGPARRTLEVLGGYVRGTAIVALVDTVAIGAALLILQVPLALPLAIIVFMTPSFRWWAPRWPASWPPWWPSWPTDRWLR